MDPELDLFKIKAALRVILGTQIVLLSNQVYVLTAMEFRKQAEDTRDLIKDIQDFKIKTFPNYAGEYEKWLETHHD